MADVLTPAQVRAKLGLGHTAFRNYEKLGRWKFLEISKPYGKHRYSRVLVEQFVNGERVTNFGAGKITARRAS